MCRPNGLGAEGGGGYEECGYADGNHNGGGGGAPTGQSQSTYLHQADPPVALRKEFGALRVQLHLIEALDNPSRLGYGAAGRPCSIGANRFLAHVTDGGLHHYEVRPLPALPLPVLGVHRAPFSGVAVPVVVRLIISLQVTISPERKPKGLVSERASGLVAEGGGCSEDYIIGECNYNGGGGGAGYFRNGDHRRAGQSQRTDPHQAEPAITAAAAALLRKEFSLLRVHIRPMETLDPSRLAYGAAGRPCAIGANCFVSHLTVGGLHHYESGGHIPVYDGGDSLFTAGTLPFDTRKFEAIVYSEDDKSKGRQYNVLIKHAAAISLLQPRMLLAGYPTDIREEVLQVLDIVDDIFVVDVSSTVPIEPLLLIDFVQKIFKIDILNGKFTKAEYAKLLKALSGMRIEVSNHLLDP
ncbi:protein argonaute 18-like [Panicum virgatum]|uniref:protein argonaute 18-like n=1 Tax=Panicum virgatum TaxID=38727 RepID=UPI0019D69B32|nr:protein argonaute 18-like [Panicum virgatum]